MPSLFIIYTILATIVNLVGSFLIHRHIPIVHHSRTSNNRLYEASTSLEIPAGTLGPPEPLASLPLGQSVNAFRSFQDDDSTRHDFAIQRLSYSPHVFLLRRFLTNGECKQIQSSAEANGMAQAETVTKGDASSRRNCQVAWLNGDVITSLISSTINIFLSQNVKSHPSAAVEDLQVLKYSSGGEFIHHHDGSARILTVIYYLNGVAGTWFPLANNTGVDSRAKRPVNKMQTLKMVQDLQPGKDGLLVMGIPNTTHSSLKNPQNIVHVNSGDAIAFYNYLDDGSGRIDWNALHCGLPTAHDDGDKWIANHWYRLNVLEDK